MKRILIVSGHYYPEYTPRAFRTIELVEEFSKRGYIIDLLIPNYGYQYEQLDNLNIYQIGEVKSVRKNQYKEILRKIPGFSIINKVRTYFTYRVYDHFSENVEKCLNGLSNNRYKLLLSIGLPISVHAGVASFLKKSKLDVEVKIADYGDPFFKNANLRLAPWFKIIEKNILNHFDFITIPTPLARSAYLSYKNYENIKIIPQGFNYEKVKLVNYKKNKIPVFAYAGTFYKDIRNPKVFFEYLSKLDRMYKFIIYTDGSGRKIIEKYIGLLSDKIEVYESISREKVIYELSKMDFLINVENKSSTQIPSKLIDYALTNRPIYGFSPDKFDEKLFNEFLNGKYSTLYEIKLEEYDIKNVVNKFLDIKNI